MKIKKGQILEVSHCRKGVFQAIALNDFDTEDSFYELETLQNVTGKGRQWETGEKITVRKELCTIKSKVMDNHLIVDTKRFEVTDQTNLAELEALLKEKKINSQELVLILSTLKIPEAAYKPCKFTKIPKPSKD